MITKPINTINIGFNIGGSSTTPPYEGEYEVTPKTYDEQTLQTVNKKMLKNVTIKKNRSICFTVWIIEDLHRNHLGSRPPSQQTGIEGRRAGGEPLVHESLLPPYPLPQEGGLPSAGSLLPR